MEFSYVIGAVVLGVIVLSLFNYLRLNKVEKTNEYVRNINMLRNDNIGLKSDIKELEHKVDVLNKTIIGLNLALIKMNSVGESFPFPHWVKGTDHTIISINNAFENQFQKQRAECIGKDDINLWGPEIAEILRKSDKGLIENPFLDFILLKSEVKNYIIIKWKVKDKGVLIALSGIAIPNFDGGK